MSAAQKFLGMAAGLFPDLAPVPAAPVVTGSNLVPLPAVPLEVTRRPTADDVAAPRVLGPCPLMREVYEDLEAVADRTVERATEGLQLSRGALRLYHFLVFTALGQARARGLSKVPTIAEMHLPGELLAFLMDVDRSTVWRWVKELGENVNEETGEVTGAQLVAKHDHKTGSIPAGALRATEKASAGRKGQGKGWKREGVSDGLLWAVSLTGPRPGLRVSPESLRHQHRDLYSDALAASRHKGTAAGLRTVWALKNTGLQQSLKALRTQKEQEVAVRWAVNPGFSDTPPLNMTVAAATQEPLSSVWDVQTVRTLPLRERGAAVDSAAQHLAALYGDTGSVGLYRWILWRLVRLDVVGTDLWDAVCLLLDQVRGDLAAGDCQTPGAVITWRLKRSGLWTHLQEAPQVRVGVIA